MGVMLMLMMTVVVLFMISLECEVGYLSDWRRWMLSMLVYTHCNLVSQEVL